ncbi:MAG: hypothetical protein MUE56_00820 [Ignavibacteria bacterium]|jgi:hypothetical protein|nr:hypothetical protein [Ignavibacteria bacterium]
MKNILRKNIVTILLGFTGLVTGFLYWKFVGCADGTCAIKSNIYLMTLYGGVIGALLGNVIQGFTVKKQPS